MNEPIESGGLCIVVYLRHEKLGQIAVTPEGCLVYLGQMPCGLSRLTRHYVEESGLKGEELLRYMVEHPHGNMWAEEVV